MKLELGRSTRYAVRSLRRSPTFTAAVILMLALGLGANAAIYSVAKSALFRSPRGIAPPGDVRRLWQRYTTTEVHIRDGFSFLEYLALERHFSTAVAAYSSSRAKVAAEGRSIDSEVIQVAGPYFALLGVRSQAGRLVGASPQELREQPPVAVISDRLWEDLFARRPLGQLTLRLNGQTLTVVGVVADDFVGIDRLPASVWVPATTLRETGGLAALSTRAFDIRWQILLESPKHSATALAAASEVLKGAQTVRDQQATAVFARLGLVLHPGSEDVIRRTIVALEGVAIALLVLTCINVSNLLINRAYERRRELAIRLMIGASHIHLALQVIVEALMLSAAAGIVAIITGVWARIGLSRLLLGTTELLAATNIDMGLAIVAATILGAGFLALFPLRFALRSEVLAALRAGDVTAGDSQVRQGFVIAQTAASILLLSGGLLFVASFRNIRRVDIGYELSDVVLAGLKAPPMHDAEAARVTTLGGLLQKSPLVEGVAYSARVPLRVVSGVPLFLKDRDTVPTLKYAMTSVAGVSPQFFAVMGVGIIEGRAFTDYDTPQQQNVVVVSRALAREYWPHERPLGQCIVLQSADRPCRVVVGIAEDVHALAITERPTFRIYVPLSQAPEGLRLPQVVLARSHAGQADRLKTAAFMAVPEKETSEWQVSDMIDLIEPEIRPWRLSATLVGASSLVGLMVAGLGIYGLVVLSANKRQREIGIRRALGAAESSLWKLLMWDGLRPVLLGIALGEVAALTLASALRPFFYNIRPMNVGVLLLTTTIFVGVGIAASTIPTARALRIDPAAALRGE